MEWFIKIPNAILQDKELLPTEKLLYWIIDSLCNNKEKVCTASNQYLSECMFISVRSIQRWIKVLSDKSYIKVWGDTDVTGVWHTCRKITTQMSPNNISNKNILSKERISTPRELVEAYKSDPQLPQMMKDVSLVQERAEYKQAKKNRAYKTIKWFIQQMKVNINTVRNNDMRADTDLRFRFAVNQSMENEWKWIFRNDKIEEQYQAWRKLYLLEQKQNE